MSRKAKIKTILEQQNNANALRLQQLTRQRRLKKLVDTYGLEDVSLAAGYTELTLKQYLRVKNPTSIGEKAVTQAESVFREIKK